ncbi:MAG: M48 family metallopeptidase [Bdellovibrionales bacterium]|nr:M48 family metallopeptidase [Bdellovibrionales bacterium]
MRYVPPNLGDSAENSAGITSWKTKAKDVAIVCSCLAVLYLAFGFVAERLAAFLPASWESRLSFAATPPNPSDPAYEAYKNTLHILETLTSTDALRELPYTLFLMETEQPNAFAIPGGGVGVTSGLLEKVTSEAGRAMVLAHELGHHQHRHTLKRLGRALVYQTAMALLFGQSANPFAEVSVAMAELRYSREQEREADEFGLRLVKKALGSTAGTLEFFEMVERENLGLNERWQALFSSHPITKDRIVYLRELSHNLDKK